MLPFELVSGCGAVDHCNEGGCKSAVACANGAIDLEWSEHTPNSGASVVVRAIMF